MKQSLRAGSAFIGIIVGAGFASGQEILQYFTSFGIAGTIAAFISTVLFAYLGMNLTRLGSRLQTTSHKEAIYRISGKYFGILIDAIIIFTLFGVGVVMIAGAGPIFSQQFGWSAALGSTVMALLIIFTIMLNVDKVVTIISSITPFLVAMVVLLCIYSVATFDSTIAVLDPIATAQKSAVSNLFVSGINYVSFNIAVGASMSLVMGGTIKDEKVAARGGLIGGSVLGIMILLSHFAIFSKIDEVGTSEMPMLQIASNLSPALGVIMSVILFGMIYNTGASMLYSFTARFAEQGTKNFRILVVIVGILAYVLSFVGFTGLVSFFYPLIGYLGLFLVVAIVIADIRKTRKAT